MAKNRIFSGQTLSESERKKIEEQLKISRERDITAQKESNKLRNKRNQRRQGQRYTDKYKTEGVSGVKKGKEAEEKWIMLKKALGKEAYEAIYTDYGSGDVIDAADYIADNYVQGEDGRFFNKEDMLAVLKEIQDEGYASLDIDDIIF